MNKRETILKTAAHLFSQHGYHAVGVDRIIEESGVAKTTMYRYFPSKEALIVEVLRERDKACADSLGSFVAEGTNALERVKRVFEWHENWFSSADFTGCMFAHAAAEFFEKDSPIVRLTAQQKRSLTLFIENQIKGLVSAREAKRLARAFVMLLDGATLNAQVLKKKGVAMEAWESARLLLPS
ncbi:TetR/AcrR family transcriptional regulator [Burkholderia glumae]|uniref:TetR/AcrR family transcriptional regulator n=1 Tax=Burkholderia glumae TaxID=337 RepID=UPI003B9B8CD4